MFEAVHSRWLVPFEGPFSVAGLPTAPAPELGGKPAKRRLRRFHRRLDSLQQRLYADNRWAVLLVFQALDAAGKDGAIRAVLRGVNPAGCQVYSFKVPSAEELDHDFLWRTTVRLPERGRIGVFNRSYYEEVLAVRVHPDFLAPQRLPAAPDLPALWARRYRSIREHEEHLARNGTVVLKFWLNVSKEEQRQRFLARLDEPEKNWKFAVRDVEERERWDAYMAAYEDALRETSRPWAPWYAIPADDKPYARAAIAKILVHSLESLGLKYPEVGEAEKARFEEMRRLLG